VLFFNGDFYENSLRKILKGKHVSRAPNKEPPSVALIVSISGGDLEINSKNASL
jgi:hypothetical protein